MNSEENTVKCSVGGCENNASLLSPLPLCTVDALRVAGAHARAVDPDTPMSRLMALTEIHAAPHATDTELAARTGWPVDWVRSHRGNAPA
jgi:hypothetical protein